MVPAIRRASSLVSPDHFFPEASERRIGRGPARLHFGTSPWRNSDGASVRGDRNATTGVYARDWNANASRWQSFKRIALITKELTGFYPDSTQLTGHLEGSTDAEPS